jgi:phosphate transport system substrate-binding protein
MKLLLFFTFFLFLSCGQSNRTIKIKGSDTEVNLSVQLAESFHKINPEFFISISGGGSGLGIASLYNNTADIANSSREINKQEIELFNKEEMKIDSFVFAQDAIAFVVSNDITIDSISTKMLANILNGNINNWLVLTGKNLPINIYGRQSNSGTHGYLKKKLKIEFSPYAKQMNGNAQILEAIKVDHTGLGYVGAGYLIHGGMNGLKLLSIYSNEHPFAVSPLNSKMIAEGKYFFQRPLFQYYKTTSFEKIKSFIDFEKSEAGKNIIKEEGYYLMNPKHEH